MFLMTREMRFSPHSPPRHPASQSPSPDPDSVSASAFAHTPYSRKLVLLMLPQCLWQDGELLETRSELSLSVRTPPPPRLTRQYAVRYRQSTACLKSWRIHLPGGSVMWTWQIFAVFKNRESSVNNIEFGEIPPLWAVCSQGHRCRGAWRQWLCLGNPPFWVL